tara:strand:+ start:5106 stop:8882 length:3777 start_codon:yes stop_codon:yes gene_type:complete
MKSNNTEIIFDPNKYPLDTGTRLIEASAGTGKTFSLAHLVLRLLTENKYSINDILVVSFTNATASEIKSKIIQRITNALKGIEVYNKGIENLLIDDVLKSWLKLNANKQEERINIASLLLDALENIDHSDITTIHGFCNRTIKREALEIDTSLDPSVEGDDSQIIKEIVYEYWTQQVLNLSPSDIQGIEKSGLNIYTLEENIRRVDNEPYLNFKIDISKLDDSKDLYIQFNSLIKEYWDDFTHNWNIDGINLENNLRSYAQELRALGVKDTKPYSPKPTKDRSKIISLWINEINANKKIEKTLSYIQIRNQNLLGDYYHPKKIYELQNNNEFKYSTRELSNLQKSIEKLWDGPAEIVWEHAIYNCINELKLRRKNNGLISKTDLLKVLDPGEKTKKISAKENLFNKLRKRYKVILVDEFQDTDPVQWRFLKYTFAIGSKHLLIMVGDPKQAIYQFRGGDLNTYLKARLEADRTDVLLSNFRTNSLLMNELNKLMSHGLKRSLLKVPPLDPLSDEKKLLSGQNHSPLQIININIDKDLSRNKLPTKKQLEEKIPTVVSNYLINLLEVHSSEIEPSDICILVNNHHQAECIRKGLSLAGLPSRLIIKGDVLKGEGARNLQLFLNCLASPGDSNHLRLLACSPLIGWTTKNLEESAQNRDLDNLASTFHSLSKSIKKLGLLGCLNELLEGREIAALSLRGRLLSDLNQCAQLVEEEIHREGMDLKGAAIWLRRQRLNEDTSIRDERLPNSDIDDSSINIITIHKSKGLQFNVVICPYLWQSPPISNGPLWRIKDQKDWLLSLNKTYKNSFFPYEESKTESLKESERLAYVALTRAKKHLAIVWARGLKQDGNPLVSFLFGPKAINSNVELLTNDKMKVWLQKNNVFTTIHDVCDKNPKGYWKREESLEKLDLGPTPLKPLDKSWGRYSYSSWVRSSNRNLLLASDSPEIEEGKDIDQQEINTLIENGITSAENNSLSSTYNFKLNDESPLAKFPRGALAGDCLHRILEKLDFQSGADCNKRDSLIEEELNRAGIDLKYISAIQKSLDRLLNIPLGGPLANLRMKDLNPQDRIHELKFDLPITPNGKAIKSIDLSNAFKKNPKAKFSSSYSKEIKTLNINSKGFLTGSIDLIFVDNSNHSTAKWWVADWKSNWIGSKEGESISCTPSHYNGKSIEDQMMRHHYPLQAHLYLVALHRFLYWRLPNYEPSRHLGGYIYFFLRGIPEMKNNFNIISSDSTPGIILEQAPVERILEINNLIDVGGR